jgi:hypothetical protein
MKCDVLNPAWHANLSSRRSPSRRASINAMHRRRVEGAIPPTDSLIRFRMPTATIMGSRTHEVIAPHMVGVHRPKRHTRTIIEPQPPSRLLPLRYLQPFTTPDAFDWVLAHLPARALEQRGDSTISIAAIQAGQRNHGLSQSIFIFTVCLALRASGLPRQKTRMPLAGATLTSVDDRTAPSFRA